MFSRQPRSPAKHRIRASSHDIARLVRHHAHRDLGILHAERAAEPAAHLRVSHLRDGGADRLQQLPRLLLDPKFAQPRATVVIGDGAARVPRGQPFDAHDVGQEADQLVSPRSHRIGARPQIWIVIEQMRQVVLQHAAARPGRHHDIIIATERIQDALGQIARGSAIAGIVRRLPAAGLRARHLDLAAGLFQQSDCREADGRPV